MEYLRASRKRKEDVESLFEKKEEERRITARRTVEIWLSTKSEIPTGKRIDATFSLSRNIRILDLSEWGAFICGAPARLESEVHIEFFLPNRLSPLRARGEVVWSRITREANAQIPLAGMGIRFTEISSKDQISLGSYLKSLTHREGRGKSSRPVADPPWERSASAKKPAKDRLPFVVSDDEIEQILSKNFER